MYHLVRDLHTYHCAGKLTDSFHGVENNSASPNLIWPSVIRQSAPPPPLPPLPPLPPPFDVTVINVVI